MVRDLKIRRPCVVEGCIEILSGSRIEEAPSAFDRTLASFLVSSMIVSSIPWKLLWRDPLSQAWLMGNRPRLSFIEATRRNYSGSATIFGDSSRSPPPKDIQEKISVLRRLCEAAKLAGTSSNRLLNAGRTVNSGAVRHAGSSAHRLARWRPMMVKVANISCRPKVDRV